MAFHTFSLFTHQKTKIKHKNSKLKTILTNLSEQSQIS